jgi:ATP-binding cassette subfamily C protein
LALVGRSGAGKSTLANLLMRLYPLEQGTITVGGVGIRDFSRESFAENVGFVSQDTILFNDTLRSNFQFVRPGVTDEQIWDALAKVKATEFVEELEDGLGTVIQEGGNRLSGGQRQRIALARALIAPKRILILDETTSQLDAFSEAAVQETIATLHGNTTLVVIAHRMSTVQKADTIAVMEAGRVIELGTPSELLRKKALFWEMMEFQRLRRGDDERS